MDPEDRLDDIFGSDASVGTIDAESAVLKKLRELQETRFLKGAL